MKSPKLVMIAAMAITSGTLVGCQARAIDVEKAGEQTLRENEGDAPATGLKQNPGRPISERPTKPFGS